MNDTLKEMFAEGQARLPEVDRAAGSGEPTCKAQDSGFKCSKRKDHEGGHVAHDLFGEVCHRWPRRIKGE